jgi:hypothetical protein
MKCYILSVSKVFPSNHPRSLEPTLFKTKILNYSKIHTIRKNYKYWQKRLSTVNEKTGYLSLRQWKDKPYYSKSEEFQKLYKVGFEKLQKVNNQWYIGKEKLNIDEKIISKNDGLSLYDFNNWFPMANYTDLIIIHFTEFRYSQQSNDEELKNQQKVSENQQLTIEF